VLHALLSSHSELIPDARRAANALLASVSFAAVAKSIVDALVKLIRAGTAKSGLISRSRECQPGRSALPANARSVDLRC
jgi:hypothetical protein